MKQPYRPIRPIPQTQKLWQQLLGDKALLHSTTDIDEKIRLRANIGKLSQEIRTKTAEATRS